MTRVLHRQHRIVNGHGTTIVYICDINDHHHSTPLDACFTAFINKNMYTVFIRPIKEAYNLENVTMYTPYKSYFSLPLKVRFC